MTKLLVGTLERVSEGNNEYRKYLRKLNNQIDERTTAFVGDIVTLSNYTADFSNTITASKDKIVTPICDLIESYVIKDLRSVETVNEQFIEKINDKIENTNIETKEDKDKFISSLDSLLNNKYLEIVSIKRVPFMIEGKNDDVEEHVFNFVEYIRSAGSYEENGLVSLINYFKKDIYGFIEDILSEISKLYQDNFINCVSSDLKEIVEYDEPEDSYRPYIPETPSVAIEKEDIPHIDMPTPIIPEEEPIHEPTADEVIIPVEKSVTDILETGNEIDNNEAIKEASVDTSEPINEEEVQSFEPKKTYDVDEILKIAKSPIINMEPANEEKSISPEEIVKLDDVEESMSLEYNEHELVDEMISRFKNRLELIDKRQEEYDNEKRLAENDEAFVKDLIESSKKKAEELDRFEEELEEKSKELDKKERELKEKINSVLPFANAVMENDKES